MQTGRTEGGEDGGVVDDGSRDVARLGTEKEVAVGGSSVRCVIMSIIHLCLHLHLVLLMHVF